MTNNNLNENIFWEWEVPRKVWHITEARWFSPISIALMFSIFFIVLFSALAIVMKFHPTTHIERYTVTFAKLPAFSAGISAFCVALIASSWWWAKFKVKLTRTGIERIFHNSTRTWKYVRIKNYHFETLTLGSNVCTLVILCNHKGKIWKIALNDSIDKSKIEEIFKDHGIPKLEQITETTISQ